MRLASANIQVIVETPSGRGYSLTPIAESLSHSSVDPGGHERCSFSIARSWLAARPETQKGSVVRVMSGLDELWIGKVDEIDPVTSDREEIAVTAYGLGASFRRNTVQVVFVDRSADGWGPPTLNTRLTTATANQIMDVDVVAGADQQALRFDAPSGRSIPDDSRAYLMYVMPEGMTAAEFQYTLSRVSDAAWYDPKLYATDDDTLALGSQDQYAQSSTSTVSPITVDPPRRFLTLALIKQTTGNPTNPAKRTYPMFAVYGDHGLPRRSNGTEPDGFTASQMIGFIVAQSTEVVARRIEATSFVIDNAAFADPTPQEDAMAEIDGYEAASWGTWGSDNVLERTNQGQFDYERRDRTSQHWTASRADFEDLDLHTELGSLFDRVELAYTDETGTPQVYVASQVVRELQQAGISQTLQVSAGELTASAAAKLASVAFEVQGNYAPARGTGTIALPVRHYRRGMLSPCHLRANGSNMRIVDALPAADLVSLDTDLDRRSTFPIKRVEIDSAGAVTKARIEFDQSADSLSVLLSRLGLAADYLANPGGGRKRGKGRQKKGKRG